MHSGFKAEPSPSKAASAALACSSPTNPFYTFQYLESRRVLGYQPWIFWWFQKGQQPSGCPAFTRGNLLGGSVVIPSIPAITNEVEGSFWQELLCFCRQKNLTHLAVNSAASVQSHIPALPGEISRRMRFEYVLNLQGEDLWDRLDSNHARNVKKAKKAGLLLTERQDERACLEHIQMVRASMDRRRARGEDVDADITTRAYSTYVNQGVGRLFQATREGQTLSSLLVLLADQGAYYQSAGTSAVGMSLGASQFLVHEISNHLARQSFAIFNLGGADSLSPGLQRFKTGFGCKVVQLEAAEFFLGGFLRKHLIATARRLKCAARKCLPSPAGT